MPRIRFYLLPLILCCLPAIAPAEQSRFALRALGVKVGEIVLDAEETQSRYSVASQLSTTGLAGAIRRVRFLIETQGRRKGNTFYPSVYTEDMDTGERESRVRLDYDNRIARASGPKIKDRGDHAVTDVQQRGAVDPLTGIYMVLRDQDPAQLCTLQQKIFDGKRLTRIDLTNRRQNGDNVQCSGTFTRVAGYKPGDLRTGSQFAVTVTYAPFGDVMRAMRVEAQTIYGAAAVVRK